MLERQPPIGGVGPPPPTGPTRGAGPPPPREYPPFYKFPPSASQASNPTPNVTASAIQRSPRLLITPSSPDNVGPALGRLGRSIGLSVEMLATVGKCIR